MNNRAIGLVVITLALSSCNQPGDLQPGDLVNPASTVRLEAQAVSCSASNAALGKASLSSSNETNANLPGQAFDGNAATRWSSAFQDNQWISVNLGSVQSICGVTLQWEAAYARSFRIEVSNDAASWTPIYSTTTGAGGTQTFSVSGSGQYVRMFGLTRALPGAGFSLYEFGVNTGTGTIGTGGTLPTIVKGDSYSLRVLTPGYTDRSLRHQQSLGYTSVVGSSSDAATRADATWKVVAGLADAGCLSFEASNFAGSYLRHQGSRLRIDPLDAASALYRNDATFCPVPSLDNSSNVSLESKNIPGSFVRHRGGEVWLDANANTSGFSADASWKFGAPWSMAVTTTLPTSDTPDFGPNVRIFDPGTPAATIQGAFDAAFNAQLLKSTAQFGDQRYTFLFRPGSYTNRFFANLGFYTTVAGLGLNPDDTSLNADLNVDSGWNLGDERNATQNFWRSAENLAITPANGTNRWAVSQAAPMRRLHIRGNLTMGPSNQDFGQGYSSGGYIADSRIDGRVSSGSQQQWYTRDSSLGSWTGANWNMVFSGVQGAPAQSYPAPAYTTLATTPASREKPFLYVDAAGKYRVFVPSLRINAVGVSWPNTAGSSIPMSQFYVARPTDSAATLNQALAQNLNLFFTPGVYHLSQTLNVTRAGTVVMGLGFPTLVPDNGVNGLQVADVDGVNISGLLFDAGTVNSPALLTVGAAGSHVNHAANPTTVQDVFFRIGGAVAGRSTTSLIVNSDNTIIDHIWAWRADHGINPTGWTINTADTGVLVNGNNVLATGLFVEHYQKYEVVWNGQGGKTIFYQNEHPYDVPDNAAWRPGVAGGYAAYKVADSVTSHELWGGGSYAFFQKNPAVVAARGFEVPNTPGVKAHDVFTVSLGNVGTISNVINNVGALVPFTDPAKNTAPSTVISYP
jgi:Alpha-L-arabinofuranosidase B (ABFB) domain/F5/8 type C domain